MWTIGHWGIGVSWIIVSVYYYGNIGYIASSIVYMLFLILILLFAVAPIRLFKIKKEYPLNLHSALYISSVFILLELSRDFYFGGFPWLVPGTVGIDTILSILFFEGELQLSITRKNKKANFLTEIIISDHIIFYA